MHRPNRNADKAGKIHQSKFSPKEHCKAVVEIQNNPSRALEENTQV